MSAGETQKSSPEAMSKQPAIEILSYLAQLEIPEVESLEELQGFFEANQVTQALATSIELHGDRPSHYVVFPAIHNKNEQDLFYGSVYPRSLGNGETEAAIIHFYETRNEKTIMGLNLSINGDYSFNPGGISGLAIEGRKETRFQEIAKAALYAASKMAEILQTQSDNDKAEAAQLRLKMHFAALDVDELTLEDLGPVEELAA